MSLFENLVNRTKRNLPGYRFSWEIYTQIILENIARKPYWLDIGAGSNIIIKEQPGAIFSVGLDISRNPDIYLDHHTGAYVVADSGNLPFKRDSFEFVSARYTIEHLKKPELTLEEVHRVLKPGGTFAMQTTNKQSPLILAARLIPFRIKRALIKKIFKESPSDTFKTCYMMNTPRSVRSKSGRLLLKELILVEDLFCQSRLFYCVSLLVYKALDKFNLDSLKNNMIAIYTKPFK